MGNIPTKDKDTIIRELITKGKATGQISSKEILASLGETDFDPNQIEQIYDTMENAGVEIVDDFSDVKLEELPEKIEEEDP